jgi:hypothetical protein
MGNWAKSKYTIFKLFNFLLRFFLSLSDFGFLNDNFFQVLIGKFSVYHENFPINFDIMGNVYTVYKNLKTKW